MTLVLRRALRTDYARMAQVVQGLFAVAQGL
jgi:hypothetical protein